jgi:hypothetical protein
MHLYCLHPFVLYGGVFNRSNCFLSAQIYFYCIIVLYVNIIIITIDDLLVRHVSICIGHLHIILNRNEVFDFLIALT